MVANAGRRISVVIDSRGAAKAARDIDRVNRSGNMLVRTLTGVGRVFGSIFNTIWRYRYRIMLAASAVGYFVQKTYGEFDELMIRTKVVLGTTASELASLRKTTLDLAMTTPYAANESAQAMLTLGRAGLTTKEVMQSIIPVLDLATVAEMDLSEAATAAAHIMRQWGLDASSMGRISDVLAVADRLAPGKISDISEALQYIGPGAAQAKIALEDVTAVLSVMANAGIEGSIAGRSLRTAFMRFERLKAGAMTPLMKLAFESLGSSVMKAVDAVKNGEMTFFEFVRTLGKAGASVGQMGFIFESTAASALLAFAGAASTADQFLIELLNSAGYAREAALQIAESFPYILKGIKASLGVLAIELMTTVGPGLKDWLDNSLRPWVNAVTETWRDAGPTWREKISAVWEQYIKPRFRDLMRGLVEVIRAVLPEMLPLFVEIGKAIGEGIWAGIKAAFSSPQSATSALAVAAGAIVGGAVGGPPGAVAGGLLGGSLLQGAAKWATGSTRKLARNVGVGVANVFDPVYSKNPYGSAYIQAAAEAQRADSGQTLAALMSSVPGVSMSLVGRNASGKPLLGVSETLARFQAAEAVTAIQDNTTAVQDNTTATELDTEEGSGVGGSIASWFADKGTGLLGSLESTLVSAVTTPITDSLEKYLAPTSQRIGQLADRMLGGLDVPMSMLNWGLDQIISLLGGKSYDEGRMVAAGAYQYASPGGGGVSASSAVHVGTISVHGVKDGQDAAEKTVREIAAYNEIASRNTARGLKRGMVSREAQER